MLCCGEAFLWLRNTVTKSFVDDQFAWHPFVTQSLYKLVSIRDRDATIELAVLYQGRCFCVVDICHWRCFPVYLFIAPGCCLQILTCKWMNISAYVIRYPIRDTCSYRDGFEDIRVGCEISG